MQPKVDVSSMTPMMMVPVGAKVEQNSKPSYKMVSNNELQLLNSDLFFQFLRR